MVSMITISKAAELLRTLKYTSEVGNGCIGEALDVAIDLLERNTIKADIDSIIMAVARETGVTENEMCHMGRHREFAEARAIVSWLARRYTPMTMTSIGVRLGRTHAAVFNYIRMVNEWLEEPRRNLRGARITTKLINEIEK